MGAVCSGQNKEYYERRKQDKKDKIDRILAGARRLQEEEKKQRLNSSSIYSQRTVNSTQSASKKEHNKCISPVEQEQLPGMVVEPDIQDKTFAQSKEQLTPITITNHKDLKTTDNEDEFSLYSASQLPEQPNHIRAKNSPCCATQEELEHLAAIASQMKYNGRLDTPPDHQASTHPHQNFFRTRKKRARTGRGPSFDRQLEEAERSSIRCHSQENIAESFIHNKFESTIICAKEVDHWSIKITEFRGNYKWFTGFEKVPDDYKINISDVIPQRLARSHQLNVDQILGGESSVSGHWDRLFAGMLKNNEGLFLKDRKISLVHPVTKEEISVPFTMELDKERTAQSHKTGLDNWYFTGKFAEKIELSPGKEEKKEKLEAQTDNPLKGRRAKCRVFFSNHDETTSSFLDSSTHSSTRT